MNFSSTFNLQMSLFQVEFKIQFQNFNYYLLLNFLTLMSYFLMQNKKAYGNELKTTSFFFILKIDLE